MWRFCTASSSSTSSSSAATVSTFIKYRFFSTVHVETQRHLWQTLFITTRQQWGINHTKKEWIEHFESLGRTHVQQQQQQQKDSSSSSKEQIPSLSTITTTRQEVETDDEHSNATTTTYSSMDSQYVSKPTLSSSTTPSSSSSMTIQSPSERDMSKAAQFLKQSKSTTRTTSATAAMESFSMTSSEQRAHTLQNEMDEWLKQRNPEQAYNIFQTAIQEDLLNRYVSPKVIRDLFFQLFRSPVLAYHVLQAYRTMTVQDYGTDITAYADMYRQMCESIQFLNPTQCTPKERNQIVGGLVQQVQLLNRSQQEMCIPVLISSLMIQKFVSLGDLAKQLYHYMRQENFTVATGYWNHLLATSKYNRRSDLPYDEIFLTSIQVGRRPNASIVMNALQNFYPYTEDTVAVQRMLQGILLLLQQQEQQQNEYPIDISMLEDISTAAAQTGMNELVLLVWDCITQQQQSSPKYIYEPSIGIYENTIVTFCSRPTTYKQAFIVLDEFQQKGYPVTRALLRSMSVQLRTSPRNIDIALKELNELDLEGCPASLAAINAILSAAAERGDLDAALSIVDEVIPRFNVQPDSDSYSFAMEAVGKHLSRRTQSGTNEVLIQKVLAAADTILSNMEGQGISPTQYILRDYVEMLCHANEIDTATSVVKELAKGTEKHLLNSKIIYCVAVANAKQGNFEVATEIANTSSEPIPFVHSVIRREKQRALGNRS